jgi:hypothetical protein
MIDLRCLGLLVTLLLGQIDPTGETEARPPTTDGAPGRGRERRIDPALWRALAAADPPVDALRAAASALALTEPDRAHSMVIRARLAGWLPEVRARVDRRFARSESIDLGSTTAGPLAPVGIDSDNDVRYELRATWDLSRLVFNPDEIGAQFQALRTGDARREIESLVIRLYFDRRRLKAEMAAADATATGMPLSGVRMELRVAEIEAELDALTGGAFTRLSRRHDAGPGLGDP